MNTDQSEWTRILHCRGADCRSFASTSQMVTWYVCLFVFTFCKNHSTLILLHENNNRVRVHRHESLRNLFSTFCPPTILCYSRGGLLPHWPHWLRCRWSWACHLPSACPSMRGMSMATRASASLRNAKKERQRRVETRTAFCGSCYWAQRSAR